MDSHRQVTNKKNNEIKITFIFHDFEGKKDYYESVEKLTFDDYSQKQPI